MRHDACLSPTNKLTSQAAPTKTSSLATATHLPALLHSSHPVQHRQIKGRRWRGTGGAVPWGWGPRRANSRSEPTAQGAGKRNERNEQSIPTIKVTTENQSHPAPPRLGAHGRVPCLSARVRVPRLGAMLDFLNGESPEPAPQLDEARRMHRPFTPPVCLHTMGDGSR